MARAAWACGTGLVKLSLFGGVANIPLHQCASAKALWWAPTRPSTCHAGPTLLFVDCQGLPLHEGWRHQGGTTEGVEAVQDASPLLLAELAPIDRSMGNGVTLLCVTGWPKHAPRTVGLKTSYCIKSVAGPLRMPATAAEHVFQRPPPRDWQRLCCR